MLDIPNCVMQGMAVIAGIAKVRTGQWLTTFNAEFHDETPPL